MKLRTLKTNGWLWFALSLIILLLSSYDIQWVFALFSGHARIAGLLSFEFVVPLILSLVGGWLAQCAIVIVLSWKREKPAPNH